MANNNANSPNQQGSELIAIPAGYQAIIDKKSTSRWDRFTAVSRLRKTDMQPKDIFDLLADVKNSAIKTFNTLKLGLDYSTNLCRTLKPTSKSDSVMFNKNLRELEKVGLVKRVTAKKQPTPKGYLTVMFNPYHIKCRNSETAEKFWQSL